MHKGFRVACCPAYRIGSEASTGSALEYLRFLPLRERQNAMNNIVWLVGAVVIIIAVLSFFGLR
jgi:hypothetical protein